MGVPGELHSTAGLEAGWGTGLELLGRVFPNMGVEGPSCTGSTGWQHCLVEEPSV